MCADTETFSLPLHGDGAHRVSERLVETAATVGARSIDRLGVDDVRRYRDDGVTLLAYEQASAYREERGTIPHRPPAE